MRLLVGLGNPGSAYEDTRHNIGFKVLDLLAGQTDVPITQKRFDSLIGRGRIDGIDVMLAKPQTFMNLSGRAVSRIFDYFKLNPEDLLVIHDEMDVEPGRMKVAARGGAGGHKGVASIIECLGFKDFGRIKVGVGRTPGKPADGHVLGKFAIDELEDVKNITEEAGKAARLFISNGIAETQLKFNRKNASNNEK